ncbi:unnamed protein product, partial [Owenia fusiformis]
MASRSSRSRGRAPKSPLSDQMSSAKPSDSASNVSSRSSTPVSSMSSTPTSQRQTRPKSRRGGRQAAEKSKTFIRMVLDDGDEKDIDQLMSDSSPESDIESDDSLGAPPSDIMQSLTSETPEKDEDTFSEYSESVASELSRVSSSSRPYPHRPKTPDIPDDIEIPPLVLPSSSNDLLIDCENVMKTVGIYEVLRRFRIILRLSPFRIEDFIAALLCNEQCNLLAEVHMALIKSLFREEDGNNTTFGPHDLKDSINIALFFMDSMTWPEVVRLYLACDKNTEFTWALPSLEHSNFPFVDLKMKLDVLQCLTDLFLGTNAVREELMNEGTITYDDHCRNCHKLGDLLCCETCSATYHLQCVEPPLEEVPEEDWVCSVCKAHKLKGVTDCISIVEKSGLLCRQEPVGYDRHGRKYWFLCRRIIVEGENEVWYYTAKAQFEELLETLDHKVWEKDLVAAFHEIRSDIDTHMEITEELTASARGHRRSALMESIESLEKRQKERAERKAREEEERKEEEAKLKEKMKEEDKEEPNDSMKEQNGSEANEVKTEISEIDKERTVSTTTTTSTQSITTTTEIDGLKKEVSLMATTTTSVTIATNTTVTATVVEKDANNARADNNAIPAGSQGDGQPENNTPGVVTEGSTESGAAVPKVDERGDKGETKINDRTVVSLDSMFPGVKATELKTGDSVPASTANPPDVETPKSSAAVKGSGAVKTVVLVNKDGSKMTFALTPKKLEDGTTKLMPTKQTTDSSHSTSSEGSDEKRYTTRFRTGSLTPKHFVDSVVSPTGSVKMTSVNSLKKSLTTENSEESVLVINKDGNITKVIKSKSNLQTSSSTQVFKKEVFFKLGMEANYKTWENQYSVDTLALNKPQHNEERDKRRLLSHKFSLTNASEFRWNGTIHGNRLMTISTLRLTVTHLENSIPHAFMHPNWPERRRSWVNAVHNCTTARDFALALVILESCIKPCVFNSVWHDNLGYLHLQRITALEREEMKKKDKNRDDQDMNKEKWVKYTLGLKHQVWKQRGEEYRTFGVGGWVWRSSTKVYKHIPYTQVGLRGVAQKIRSLQNKDSNELRPDENMEHDTDDIKTRSEPINTKDADSEKTIEPMEVDETQGKDISSKDVKVDEGATNTESMETDNDEIATSGGNNDLSQVRDGGKKPDCDIMIVDSDKDKSTKKEEGRKSPRKRTSVKPKTPEKFEYVPASDPKPVDVIDVSSALKNRTYYPKVTTPYSKLNTLLPRRIHQFEMEVRKQILYKQTIEKCRRKLKEIKEAKIQDNEPKKENGVDKDGPVPQYCCYSSDCRNATNPHKQCYSPLCRRPSQNISQAAYKADSPVEEKPKARKHYFCYSYTCRNNEDEEFECYSPCCQRNPDSIFDDNDDGCNGIDVMMVEPKTQEEIEKECENMQIDKTEMEDLNSLIPNGITEESEPVKVEPKKQLELEVKPTPVKAILQKRAAARKAIEEFTELSDSDEEPVDSGACDDTKKDEDYNPYNDGNPTITNHNHEEDDDVDIEGDEESPKKSFKPPEKFQSAFLDFVKTDNPKLIRKTPKVITVTPVSSSQNSNKFSLLTKQLGQKAMFKSVSIKKSPPAINDTLKVEKKVDPSVLMPEEQAILKQISLLEERIKPPIPTKVATKIPKYVTKEGKIVLASQVQLQQKKALKSILPVCQKFLTKSKQMSIFVLEKQELRKLARTRGMREVSGFNYNCKMYNVNWNYPCPRPYFKTAWRWRLQTLKTLAAVGLHLHVMWACVSWDDINAKTPIGGTNTVTTENDITTKELLKRRDVGLFSLRSEYLVRKIVVPINMPEVKKEKYTPIRKGLRERKRPESPKMTEPSITETWVPEENLQLWEIKMFYDKVERQKMIKEIEPAKSSSDVSTVKSSSLSGANEELKAQLEAQLKQQRIAMQQKRLAEQGIIMTTTSKTPTMATKLSAVTKIELPPRSTITTVTAPTRNVPTVVTPGAVVTRTRTVHLPGTTMTIRPKITMTTSSGMTPQGIKVVPQGMKMAPRLMTPTSTTKMVLSKPQVVASGSATTTSQAQSVQIIQSPTGQLQVRGLLPGQQIIRLPDGRLQLITVAGARPQTPAQQQQQQQPQAQNTPTVNPRVVSPGTAMAKTQVRIPGQTPHLARITAPTLAAAMAKIRASGGTTQSTLSGMLTSQTPQATLVRPGIVQQGTGVAGQAQVTLVGSPPRAVLAPQLSVTPPAQQQIRIITPPSANVGPKSPVFAVPGSMLASSINASLSAAQNVAATQNVAAQN